MAVAVASTASAAGNSTVSKPSGVVSGDTLEIACQAFNHTTHTAPTGFTQVQQLDDASGNNRLSIWRRIADGSEASTFTVGGPPSGSCNIGCRRITGAHATTPVLTSDIGVDTGTNHITGPIDTSGVDGCLLLADFGDDTQAITRPSGMASDWNLDGGDFDGSNVVQTTGGSVSKTATNGTNRGVNCLTAIQPPAAGSAPAQPNMVAQMAAQANW